MKYKEKDLDKTIKAVRWPTPSKSLKGSILDACDDHDNAFVFNGFVVNQDNKSAFMFCVIVMCCFMLGTVTGNYKTTSTDFTLSDSYLYTGTGTVLASSLFSGE
ncbi:MAG: hypothetical protein GY793_01420 [Proteobacteria bacterium]|nr:hypothetical protein [Pseudomonadota bacterium]